MPAPQEQVVDPEAERALVERLSNVFRDPAERAHYLADSWRRMQITLGLLGDLHRQGVHSVLELGSNPYLLTTLMMRRYDFELTLANYFGDKLGAGQFTHVAELAGERVEFAFQHFNMEVAPFPYPDASFDAVLFCEILEHLLLSPDHAVAEMSRIVRPGGRLMITTPNAARLTNLYFLALGRNIWDGYSANGPYGRHNREWVLSEVVDLMARHGFDLERAEVKNVQPLARRFTWLQKLRPTVWHEHLFVIGRRR